MMERGCVSVCVWACVCECVCVCVSEGFLYIETYLTVLYLWGLNREFRAKTLQYPQSSLLAITLMDYNTQSPLCCGTTWPTMPCWRVFLPSVEGVEALWVWPHQTGLITVIQGWHITNTHTPYTLTHIGIHTDIHTCTYTHWHAHAFTHTPHTLSCTLTFTRLHIHTHINMHSLTQSLTVTHILGSRAEC